MGTSVSQRSPKTTNWGVVDVGYSSEQMPVERLTTELWRAATNQGEANLAVGLAAPVVAECLKVVLTAESREEAAASAGLTVAFSGQASLAADIAQRAVVQSIGLEGDRATNFARALFSEAGNYLVSRDLSGFVGPGGRARTVSEAIRLKGEIRSRIDSVVVQESPPPRGESAAWGEYVQRVVSRLTAR